MARPSRKAAGAKRRLFEQSQNTGDNIDEETKKGNDSRPDEKVDVGAEIQETPQKKTTSSFFSPKKTALVTPDQASAAPHHDDAVEVEAVSPPLKRTRLSHRFSPFKEQGKKIFEEEPYVPTHIHKNLSYKRQGVAVLPKRTLKVFELIQEHYDIPKDMEQNRSYGPLSGTSYEERVISAYSLSLLASKTGGDVDICVRCTEMGHRRNDCPQLV